MIEWIERKKRKHNCKIHFDDNSFRINHCVVAPVHTIPDDILPNQEFDFYLQTSYDIYFLRLINSTEKCGTVYPAKKDGIVYIVCFLPISKHTIATSIQTIMNCLKQYGFPNMHNPKANINFTIED
ncbi:hypothetical protein [Filifactor alocis]|uniref:hypothetical protein n=1 Tax=Filifactor alocis TaxID=143361 RepID=UPI003F9EDE1B